ncbi:hypothetical protein SUGI_0418190 [Cryptomeria japonica]|nr:hypothetical protein SUGI_0418190 [Cryptomeria japonica]
MLPAFSFAYYYARVDQPARCRTVIGPSDRNGSEPFLWARRRDEIQAKKGSGMPDGKEEKQPSLQRTIAHLVYFGSTAEQNYI